ncbi:MAG TPA: DUF5655 domain-containing protein [Candidatus Dormibacteraeota bacterium]|jgi:hypothetical protein|nr:DUF5655 domain-containing protein [Candidatus Dormibacteraeota bacterium]
MTTPEEGIQAQVRNIEARYGRPLDAWFEVIRASGLTRHSEVVAMLKADHGMAHGAAHRVSLLEREEGTAPAPAGDPADLLYQGGKAPLRPIHDRLWEVVDALGDDVEVAPKKGYLSLRRKRQFAMIQPAAAHVDLGLILRGAQPSGRLEPSGSVNALFTHRVRIRAVQEVDAELSAWLQQAYAEAG